VLVPRAPTQGLMGPALALATAVLQLPGAAGRRVWKSQRSERSPKALGNKWVEKGRQG
jgi:hypothetical protein